MPLHFEDLSANEIVQNANKLFSDTERTNQSNIWSELAEFLTPNNSGYFIGKQSPGSRKTQRLYDSTAISAVDTLAASIQSTLTSPSTKWSEFKFKDDTLNNNRQASSWLSQANDILHSFINESNFNTQVSQGYHSMASLGTMALFAEAAPRDRNGNFTGIRFNTWSLSEIAFTEDAEGKVKTIYRQFRLTAHQLISKFPNIPDDIKDKAISDPQKEYNVIHFISPRDSKDVDLNEDGLAPPEKRPFQTKYVLKSKSNHIIMEDGFYELPFFVTRWDTEPGEVYGRGPGHIALPDVRSLNKVKEMILKAAGRAIRPAWGVSNRAIIDDITFGPDDVNVLNGGSDSIFPINSPSNFDVSQLTTAELKDSINSIFFVDKLMLPPRTETGEMTAFEIQQRLEQMQRVIGPTLSRLNSEFLTPLVERIFGILFRAGQFPELPNVLKQTGVDIEIKFVNPLNRSQQLEEVNNIRSWVQNILELAQAKQEALLYIDTGKVVQKISDARNVPADFLVPEEEVQKIIQQQRQIQQQQQQAEQAEKIADARSKEADANQNQVR